MHKEVMLFAKFSNSLSSKKLNRKKLQGWDARNCNIPKKATAS